MRLVREEAQGDDIGVVATGSASEGKTISTWEDGNGTMSGADLLIALRGSSDQITVQNHFAGAALDRVEFGAGPVWSAADIADNVVRAHRVHRPLAQGWQQRHPQMGV